MQQRSVVFIVGAVVFAAATVAGSAETGCVFNVIDNETEKNQPVPLYNVSSQYDLAIPHQGLIHLGPGQKICLLCSGNRNYVRQTNSNVTTVTCIKNDEVKLYSKHYKFEEIQCKNIVKGDVRATHVRCGNNQGSVYQIGYPVTRRDWITLITACYVPVTGNTLYTRHVIHGKEIKYASKNKYRPSFSTAGQFSNITASLAYKQVYQKSTFSSILGSSDLAGRYINNKSFLARGHLSPDADFLLATAQVSTYYYINAAPQWQSINGASWKSIEFTVRDLSTYYGDLDVFTGTHGVLSYNDKENYPQDIYLGRDQTLAVPKYFWKVAYDPTTKSAMAFVIINDPHIESVKEATFCNDICEENGFSKKTWKDPTTGYVFCCSFDAFRNVVRTMPRLEVVDVLAHPSVAIVSTVKRLKLNDINDEFLV